MINEEEILSALERVQNMEMCDLHYIVNKKLDEDNYSDAERNGKYRREYVQPEHELIHANHAAYRSLTKGIFNWKEPKEKPIEKEEEVLVVDTTDFIAKNDIIEACKKEMEKPEVSYLMQILKDNPNAVKNILEIIQLVVPAIAQVYGGLSALTIVGSIMIVIKQNVQNYLA